MKNLFLNYNYFFFNETDEIVFGNEDVLSYTGFTSLLRPFQKNNQHFLILLKKKKKQFFINIFSLGFKLSKFVSSGRLLRKSGVFQKSLKSSKKAQEFLKTYIDLFLGKKKNLIITIFLKPTTKQSLFFFKSFQKNFSLEFKTAGLSYYYSNVKKKAHRIKKKIKKKIVNI